MKMYIWPDGFLSDPDETMEPYLMSGRSDDCYKIDTDNVEWVSEILKHESAYRATILIDEVMEILGECPRLLTLRTKKNHLFRITEIAGHFVSNYKYVNLGWQHDDENNIVTQLQHM